MAERRRRLVAVAAALTVLGLSSSAPAAGQTRQTGRLLVTVSDQSGAVLPGATVIIVGLDATTRALGIAPVKTSDQGVSAIAGLAPGRYAIQAEFPGFQTRTFGDARIRAGDNPQHIVLEIERLQTEITVGRDAQSAAADPRGAAFGSAFTRDQIDPLPDNPEEMKRQLADMAGPGAVIRVDSFEGAELPAKAQIKSIHVTRDAFAAENHNAGTIFIDIITQPGIGPLRGGGRFNLRDGALSASNPFTPTRGSARPPGIRIINLNGAPQVDAMSLNEQPRFRLLVYVQAQNLTDRYNYAGYSHDIAVLRRGHDDLEPAQDRHGFAVSVLRGNPRDGEDGENGITQRNRGTESLLLRFSV